MGGEAVYAFVRRKGCIVLPGKYATELATTISSYLYLDGDISVQCMLIFCLFVFWFLIVFSMPALRTPGLGSGRCLEQPQEAAHRPNGGKGCNGGKRYESENATTRVFK